MSLAIPSSLLRSFSRSTLSTVECSIDKLKVSDVVFFRNAYAGTVTESGRRSYTAFLVVGASRKFESASCTCSPTMKPEDLCRHLAVLTHRIVDDAGTFPGERFESSIWCEIGKLLLEAHGAAANVDSSGDALRIASDAEVFTMKFEESSRITLRADDFREQRLRKLSMSPQEIELAKRGSRSQRQLWEDSVWFDLARALFRNAKRFGSPLLVRRDGVFRLEANEGAATFSLALPARAVGALIEQEGIAARGGFAIVENGAFPSVSMALAPNGELQFDPVLVFDCAEPHLIARRATAGQYGRYFLLEKADGLESPSSTSPSSSASFVSLREMPPLFAETTPGEQASLFASVSSRRVSADRPSTIAAPDVFRFLERHRDEIRSMPAALVPAELRDIVPLRAPDEAMFDFASADPIALSVTYRGGGATFPWHEVHAARLAGLSAICRDSVWLQTTAPEFSWMDAVAAGEGKPDIGMSGHLRVTPLEYLRLRALTRVPVTCRGDAQCVELFNRFESLRASSSAPTLADLGLDLYGYQQTGYQWLWFLQENSFGGLLCDDMGLGKTHQAIALMRACTLRDPGASILVVCPTSLIDHWREKLERYLPATPATIHYGSDRSDAAGAQLVVTSYGLLRNDIEKFASRRFDLLILDEMQTIKNRSTATHQALARVPRGVAIGLTGTPVENRVEELRSLLDFVMPNYLPGETEFRRVYADPIEHHRDRIARERLHRLVNPFILRRTKEQVLDQLPEKIVDKRYCEMTDAQRDLYRALVASKGRLLREQLKGERVPYIHIFALLNHLKAICNHPATFDAEYAEVASGKWNLFCELMEESMQSGLKVVVFSQYVRMLKRIESWLDEQSIGWATIKGDTRDRGKMIERFRSDDDCRVFTASLRAGGLGIDLTAASVVIHYDRWWNQAREDQATDRVHRLGQNKGVQVLKLITRGTLEEKIDAMIERKGALAGSLVKEDDATLVKQFSREELEELLA